jgi:hypothetical protein
MGIVVGDDDEVAVIAEAGSSGRGGPYGANMAAVYPTTNDAANLPGAAAVDVYVAATNTGNIASLASVAASYATSAGWSGDVIGTAVLMPPVAWSGADLLRSTNAVLDAGDWTVQLDWCAETAATNETVGAWANVTWHPVAAVARWDVDGGFVYVAD